LRCSVYFIKKIHIAYAGVDFLLYKLPGTDLLAFLTFKKGRKRCAQSSGNSGKLKTLCSAFRKLRKVENAVLSFPETQESRKRCAQLSGNSGKPETLCSSFLKLRKVENAVLKLPETRESRKRCAQAKKYTHTLVVGFPTTFNYRTNKDFKECTL
jgi:hypothetical protein